MTLKPLKISKVFYTTCFFIFSIHIFSQTQLGSDIDGEAANDQSGYSVSLSSDGTIVAIGAIGNEGNGSSAGHTRIYQYSSDSWSQLGGDIDGEAASDNSGYSVSLSSDGTKVAIGAYGNDGTGSQAGHTRIYQYSSGSWSQLGSDIDGERGTDYAGFSVSLSGNGNIVAIGAPLNAGVNGSSSGHARIYQFSNNSWSQLGSDIDGDAAGDFSGCSVSLSDDGTKVAIGAYFNDVNGTSSGNAEIYQFSNNSWSEIGPAIAGEAAGDAAGWSVSLSGDGTKVAIGASANDGNGENAGHVRIYTIICGYTDTDGDGIGDTCDDDDDNDGVPDSQDAFPTSATESIDTDGDGIGDNADPDADNDGILDISDNCILTSNIDQADLDGDGIGDACDPDTDGDGYTYYSELSCGTSDTDASSIPLDNDGDFIADCVDDDDDNDGYKDTNDIFPFDASEWADNDADGTGDNADTDDDNDGWLDTIEQTCGTDPNDSSDTPIDSDNDGEPNCIDTDDDNDTYLDTEDAFPLDPLEWADNDLDSIGDNADTDDDNDEYLDVDEIACQSDPLDSSSLPLDYDGDLSPDCIDDNDDNDYCLDVDDDFPLNKDLCVDSDGDGIDNRFELDADDDGIPDYRDDFPFDATESKDTDGDGIGDNVDQDDNNDGFSDEGTIVSTALTPNQPGIESTWKIINIDKYPFTSVKVYSPDGSEVYKSTNYQNDWSGNNIRTGSPLSTGPYYYRIALGGNSNEIKEGWLYIFN